MNATRPHLQRVFSRLRHHLGLEMMNLHVKVGTQIVRRQDISSVDCRLLEERHRVTATIRESASATYSVTLEGQAALDLVMELRPAMVEGRRLRFARHAWAFHNLVAHPALQVLAWAGLHKLGFAIHDATIPKPKASPHGE